MSWRGLLSFLINHGDCSTAPDGCQCFRPVFLFQRSRGTGIRFLMETAGSWPPGIRLRKRRPRLSPFIALFLVSMRIVRFRRFVRRIKDRDGYNAAHLFLPPVLMGLRTVRKPRGAGSLPFVLRRNTAGPPGAAAGPGPAAQLMRRIQRRVRYPGYAVLFCPCMLCLSCRIKQRKGGTRHVSREIQF